MLTTTDIIQILQLAVLLSFIHAYVNSNFFLGLFKKKSFFFLEIVGRTFKVLQKTTYK